MKKRTPLNEWAVKTAKQCNLSITTIKTIYHKSIAADGKVNQAEIRKLAIAAMQNRDSRKNKSIHNTSLLTPNSYLIQQLLSDKINKHCIYDYDISQDAKYSYCLYSADDRENLKIDRNEYEKTVFYGLSYIQMLMLSAVYTAVENNLCTSSNNDWGDTIYHIQPQTLYQIINTGKRWAKLTAKQKLEFSKNIDSLQELQKINGRMYVKGMKEAIEDDRGTLLMRCSLQLGKSLDDNILKVIINPHGLLAEAKKQKRIVSIPAEMLDYGRGSIEGALIRWYISYRIRIRSQKMQKSILFKTLDSIADGKASRKMIKGYMKYLAEAGFITDDYRITRHGIQWNVPEPTSSSTPLIIMHNDKGELSKTAPEKTEEVKEREKTLYVLNEMSKKYDVRLNGKKIETRLHCTYCNDDWSNGGRLYTGANGYQSLSQTDRAKLTINGHKVAELDYSGYHTHLLYALKGQQLSSDPYSFYPIRKAAKLALNITINAQSKDAAIAAFTAKWKEQENTPVNTEELFEAMEQRHAAISEYFYSGAGVGLQYIDSCIAINVLNAMRAKRIIALPVHDSFIVDARYADRLNEVMTEEYKQYTGGFSCPVTAK